MRILVDMSVTLLHNGHIRLLKQAKEYGTVVVGLTSDEEIFRRKGYHPELPFDARKEMLEAVKYVDEVVETPWLITAEVLQEHCIDMLFHGSDNSNDIPPEKLITVPRTEGISSSELRRRSVASIVSQKNRRAYFTPGPGNLAAENLLGLGPCFGRGDELYRALEERVLTRLRGMSGHSRIARLQGSASLALEIAVRSFVSGRVLAVVTGFYGKRLAGYCRGAKELGGITDIDVLPVGACAEATGRYDWLVTVATETSNGYLNGIADMRKLADRSSARLLVDATASMGLENDHDLADVVAFSSCKGLFGITGASFIAHNDEPRFHGEASYLDFATHTDRKVTGPYHAICALDSVLDRHDELRDAVRSGKRAFCTRYADRLVHSAPRQPLLCTAVRGTVKPLDDDVVLYEPREAVSGTSVVCHLGEAHLGRLAAGAIYDRLTVIP